MEAIIKFISTINTLVSFSVFCLSVLILFQYLGYKYKRAILIIFNKPFYFEFFFLIKIVFNFRKNLSLYTKMFIEYMIFNSKGEKINSEYFRRAYSYFYDLYIKNNRLTYCVHSTFEAEKSLNTEYMRRYFKYFDSIKHRQNFKLDTSLPLKFNIELTIENGYLIPITSIPGLQDHYNDDWSRILNRFIASFSSNVNANELFMFYTWLMWGPSYSINYQRREYKLIQFGIGDESKSINVILNSSEKGLILWDALSDSLNSTFGMFSSLTLRIINKNDYLNTYTDMFGNEVLPFVQRLSESESPIVLELSDFNIGIANNETKYFFSAYIWALFIRNNENTQHNQYFDISNCVAFFEHANLADKENYNFLLDCLIKKIINHFISISDSCKEKFYLNATFNNAIKSRLTGEIEKIRVGNYPYSKWFQTNIVLYSYITTETLLDRFDEQFSSGEVKIKFNRISLTDKKSIELLSKFYVNIYIDSFPDINERESLDNFLQYLKNEEEGINGKNHYYILLATINEEVVGGIIGDYFHDINSGVFEFVVTDLKKRRQRIAARLIQEMQNLFNIASQKYYNRKTDYIFIEMENPFKMDEKTFKEGIARVEFWRKQRFKALEFDYIQPSIEKGKQEVTHLILSGKICNTSLSEKSIKTVIIKKLLYNYAKYAMSIENPYENETINHMINSLTNEDISLVLLDDYFNKSNHKDNQ